MEQQKEYYAFISYKREDEKWAKWLQDKLEHYKFPTNLNGRTDLPKNIRPTFRDVTDLSPEPLEQAINNALCNSEWLIVVCSPRSARSPWVCKEAQTFIDLGRADHIIPFVIEGNPFSEDIASECYPEALLHLTGSQELLAANINEMGRDAAVIKVVARMFGLKFDSLWQRYEREQRRRRNIILGASLLFALICLIIGIIIIGYKTNFSRILAGKTEQLIEKGDAYLGRLIALESLSIKKTPEAESALRKATGIESGICRGHYGEIYSIAYCPSKKIIASASRDSTIRIWDVMSGKNKVILHGHQSGVGVVLFYHNGDKIISASQDNHIKIWDLLNESCDTSINIPNLSPRALSLNRDESILAAASGKNIILFNPHTFDTIATLHGHTDKIQSLCFFPDGRHLVSASSDKTLKVWSIDSTTSTDLSGHEKRVISCDISPDGKTIASSSSDKTIRLWDINTKKCIDTLYGHRDEIASIRFDETGKKLVSASFDNDVRIWDIDKSQCDTVLSGHTRRVYSAIMIDKSSCLSASSDMTIRIWDINPNQPYKVAIKEEKSYAVSQEKKSLIDSLFDALYNILDNIEDCPSQCVCSLNDSLIFVGHNRQNKIFVFKNNNESFLIDTIITIKGARGSTSLNISYDGRNLAVSNRDNNIYIYDIASKSLVQCLSGHSSMVMSVAYSPDNKKIISADKNGTVILWIKDENKWKHFQSIQAHYDIISQVSFSHNSNFFATASIDKQVKLWKISNDIHITLHSMDQRNDKIFRHSTNVTCVATIKNKKGWCTGCSFSPTDNYMAGISEDGNIIIWKYTYGKLKLIKTIEQAHYLNISSIAFSSSGKYMVSSSIDNTVKVWDVKSGILLQTFTGDNRYFRSVCFSHDEKHIIATNEDEYLYIWNFEPLDCLITKTKERFRDRVLTHEERQMFYLD